jgi:S1-C subfamily serine protease
MFNMDGEVIGIVSHIISQSGGSEGLGFVITSNMARNLLLEQKSVWFGLQGFLLQGELAQILNVPPPGVGLLVQKVAHGSPAEALGLRGGFYQVQHDELGLILGGDIILEVMDVSIAEVERVRSVVRNLKPGQTLRLTVLRGGKTMKILHQMTPEELPQ